MKIIQELFKKFKMAATPEDAARIGSALLFYLRLLQRQAEKSEQPDGADRVIANLQDMITQLSGALKELGLNPQQIIKTADARAS